jgi:N-glycosylase/DNA lyase
VNIEKEGKNLVLTGVECINLPLSLDCGQAFRWECNENEIWHGVANGIYLELTKLDDGTIVLYNTDENTFNSVWSNYFDLDRNYNEIIEAIKGNEILKNASEFGKGIRVLNQEPWEALCSFIISQNNNIPRIKGIVERLCENFGEKIDGGYTFPSAQVISKLSLDDLAVIRSGFRAKYILDAAQKIASGEIDLNALKQTDYDTARSVLMGIKGVGPKVADCVLLYGLSHKNAFPRDVWINRALDSLFDGKIPDCVGNYGGIVQQYIFHYIRNNQ